MFFLFRLAAAACNLLHVGCRTRSPWPRCQPPWTEMQQAACDTWGPLWDFRFGSHGTGWNLEGRDVEGKTKACPVSYPASNLWQHT